MSSDQPWVISDDEDGAVGGVPQDVDCEILDDRPEIFQDNPVSAYISEKQSFTLRKGVVIKVGDTVELKNRADHPPGTLQSGDFLRVKRIIQDAKTDEVILQGHRLRRVKYLGPMFDRKLNELAMVLRVREDDMRCPFVAGIEDVAATETLRLRECSLTNAKYPHKSFRDGAKLEFPAFMTKKDITGQIFEGGRLTCRAVYIMTLSPGGKPYNAVIRRLYAAEADGDATTSWVGNEGSSVADSIVLDDDAGNHDAVSSARRLRARCASLEMIEASDFTNQMRSTPLQQKRFLFADIFCGCGGASQGAKQADLEVRWGLDHNRVALDAYALNHPGARCFHDDAHDFLFNNYDFTWMKVDVLHLSPPCQFFSPAHVRPGKGDQLNMEAIFTIGPILQKLRPRVAVLEETSGLLTHKENQPYFLALLNGIRDAEYNLRYKLQDISEFGLSQRRVRLLIIAARWGEPLPPFPMPTNGPFHSGLEPFRSISYALAPLQVFDTTHDLHHQPELYTRPRQSYDPRNLLQACITTGGCARPHFSGTRGYTSRELSLLQSFPIHYKITGTKTESKKQIGNAFPPVMAEHLFKEIVKTLEAFDNGLIGAEDDLSDFDALLRRKGVGLPQPRAPVAGSSQPSYRYLTPGNIRTDPRPTSFASPFARNKYQPRPQVGSTPGFSGKITNIHDHEVEDVIQQIADLGQRKKQVRRTYHFDDGTSVDLTDVEDVSDVEETSPPTPTFRYRARQS